MAFFLLVSTLTINTRVNGEIKIMNRCAGTHKSLPKLAAATAVAGTQLYFGYDTH